MNKAVFLDRDGVLNASISSNGVPKPPMRIEEVVILDGVIDAINTLKTLGFLTLVLTNQPDVARGTITEIEVNEINAYISSKVQIDKFYVCFHDDGDKCSCRKPLPGLINLAIKEFDVDVNRSFLVGDRWKDIETGQSVGCRSYFIDYEYNEPKPNPPYEPCKSLFEAVNKLKSIR